MFTELLIGVPLGCAAGGTLLHIPWEDVSLALVHLHPAPKAGLAWCQQELLKGARWSHQMWDLHWPGQEVPVLVPGFSR